jgi:putative nucleotidyltransferase with HDIG domain
VNVLKDDPLRALAEIAERAWLVGGALRDRLLGRATADFDVAVDGDRAGLARELGRRARGHAFPLSEGFGGWRVISHRRSWQVDLLPLSGGSIIADLGARDFTVNALAQPLGSDEVIDPFGGLADLDAGRLRMVSAVAFEQDPLRVLRLARLACELGFSVDEETRLAATESAAGLEGVAAERIFYELKRIITADTAVYGLEQMDAAGATAVVLPELERLRGVEQSHYHHLDVHEHTRAVLAETIALERNLEAAFGEHADALADFLNTPLADGLSRGQALRFGALLHDIAKPETRDLTPRGRVTFIGHDELGAQLAGEMLSRLRASERLREQVAALARHHLRLGFLVHAAPLPRREVYRYLLETEPVAVDVTVLSVADRLATRGAAVREAAIASHLALARELVGEALAWTAAPPQGLVRGDELARELGIEPGPELGRLLRELREAAFMGEVRTRAEALELAASLHRGSAG